MGSGHGCGSSKTDERYRTKVKDLYQSDEQQFKTNVNCEISVQLYTKMCTIIY